MKILGVFFVAVAVSNLYLAYRVAMNKIKLGKSAQIVLCITSSVFIFVFASNYLN